MIMKYYTEAGKLLSYDTNTFFDNQLIAYKYAQSNHSYAIQVFNESGRHAGYAVPK